MKKIFLCLIALSTIFSSCQKDSGTIQAIKDGKVITVEGETIAIEKFDDPNGITFFVVRHAEKASESDDPPLSDVGVKRADRLAEILINTPINLATSSNFLRTTQTANPFVKKSYDKDNKIEISVYDPNDLNFFFDDILEKRKGQKILVVGHSNSVPNLLNLFLDKVVYKDIPESEYDNFYIVTYRGKGNAEVTEFKY